MCLEKKIVKRKELLHLCTKQLHFTFNNNIYIQHDGDAMGSALGSLLQEDSTPTLKPCLYKWKRYVNDTYGHLDPSKVEFILSKLNNHYPNIKLIFGLEKSNNINFLKVLIKRLNSSKLKNGVYRKPTNTYPDAQVFVLSN